MLMGHIFFPLTENSFESQKNCLRLKTHQSVCERPSVVSHEDTTQASESREQERLPTAPSSKMRPQAWQAAEYASGT